MKSELNLFSKIINVAGFDEKMQIDQRFGEIQFVQSAKARRINVKILENGLKVTLPIGTSTHKALEFIGISAEKIRVKQEKLRKLKSVINYQLTENLSLKTHSFEIILKRATRSDIFFSFKNQLLTIEFPENVDYGTKISQKQCWKGINYFLRKEALRLLPYRTQELAQQHGFAFSSVKIQSSRTRWGSCSRYKSINLSLFLLLLPEHLIDYVILHELCHTRQMNHSPKFWLEMDKVTQNRSKALRTELKTYSIPQF